MTNVTRTLRLLALVAALSLLAALLPTGAGAAAEERRGPRSEPAGEYAPDEVIVKWAPGTSPSARSSVRSEHGLVAVRSAPWLRAELHRTSRGGDPAAVARRLSRDTRVEYAQPNFVYRALAEPPNDPGFPFLWGLQNTGQTINGSAGLAGTDVGVLDAWDESLGEDVVVAVIDEGTDRDHPDLSANMWVNPEPGSDPAFPEDHFGWDFFNGDNTVFDPADGDTHGTHVSGTVAAVAGNGVGVAGVAPQATLMPLKFLGPGGTGNTFDAAQAVGYAADRGVRVANNSWGGAAPDNLLRDAIAASGMAFIAAAGNEGADNDATPTYPCNYDLPNVLCVAAVENDGDLAGYSNYGDVSVHVGAPGSSILSTFPRVPDMTLALQIETATYAAMFWGFDLSDVVGDGADKADVLDRALGHLGTAADDPILLVDDDESALTGYPDVRALYQDALTASGYTDVTVHDVTPDTDGPTAAQMAGHTVVWFTGNAFGAPPDGPTTITAADQTNLASFLDGGGNLLLGGADAIFGIEDSTFVTDWLHVDFQGETTGRAGLEGQPGTVYEGAAYDLVANEFLDNVDPASAAATRALMYPGEPTYDSAYAFSNGTSMATPHVSGVAALVAGLRPDLSGEAIVALLKDTVAPLASLDGVTTTGGMVDAAAAVQAALDVPEPTVPGAPSGVSAVAGDGQASVSWSAPADDGGSAITGYTVTAEPGGATATVGGDVLEATVTGLSNGTAYTFTVHATNAVGDGPPSEASAPVTPVAAPGAPTGVSAVAGDGEASVSWSAPADDGGSAITGYTVTAEPGGATATVGGDVLEATVTGLSNGTAYTFTVHATNAVGDGPPSASSNAVTPASPEACPQGAVPGAGFTDVGSGNVHAAAIDCAAWYGLAQGTGPTTFAPGASVRRDQMASFIGRLVEAAGVELDTSGSSFGDIAGNVHAPRINGLANAGIVQGVRPGVYAPEALVTRDQMASFLVRTYEFLAEQELPAPPHGFTDVAGNVHATSIAKSAGAGFARGLTDTTYGPRQQVRRDQMASFLTRVLQRLVEDGLAQSQA